MLTDDAGCESLSNVSFVSNNLSKEHNQPFQLLLTRYTLERLLYRLSQARYRDRFVLKGAMLMTTWIKTPFRPTGDLDLLAFGDADPDAMLDEFREICAVAIAR